MRMLVALFALTVAGSALAQADKAPPAASIRFYVFDEPEDIVGMANREFWQRIEADRRKVAFPKLYQLNQKSVLAKMKQTAKDVALR